MSIATLAGGIGACTAMFSIILAASLVLSGLVEQMLFGISAHDPLLFVVNAALILLVGLAACIVPAVRATALAPSSALRGS